MIALTGLASSALHDPIRIDANPNTITSLPPNTTPAVPSAGPKVKPTTFIGGHWPGMGPFH
jgi:hypothetical protein